MAGLVWGMTALERKALIEKPELATLNECLIKYDLLQQAVKSGKSDRTEDLKALEIYIAGQFAPIITNTATWKNSITQVIIPAPLREDAEQILTRAGTPTDAERAPASARVTELFKKPPDAFAREAQQHRNLFFIALTVTYVMTGVCVVIPCLVGSMLFRGGALVHLLGIVLVDRKGVPASRWRVTARNLVAWLPFALVPATMWVLEILPFMVGPVVVLAAVVSLLLPDRGLPDRLARTWPVPK